MAGLADAVKAAYRGEYIIGLGDIRKAAGDDMPIEVRVEFDTAIERSDFVTATDAISKWLEVTKEI